MKPQAALVGTNRVVELDPPSPVGPNIALIVFPGDAKDHNPIRLGHPFQNLSLLVLRMILQKGNNRLSDFLNGLMKFGFVGVAFAKPLHEALRVTTQQVVNIGGSGLSRCHWKVIFGKSSTVSRPH
jgi:hypothetical protein